MKLFSSFFLNERNIVTSLLMIHLKCTVVHWIYFFAGFFWFLIYVYFNEAFKSFMKNLSFFNTNFQNSFQDVLYYRILGCQTFWYLNGVPLNISQNLKKYLLFRSEIYISEIFFKRLYKENFEDLQINSNWKFQTCATMSNKIATL